MSDKQNLEIKLINNAISLDSIGRKDLDLIRRWKNKNKKYFFYKKDISPKEQLVWFEGYLSRKKDYIFIIKYRDEKIGCIGFRVLGKLVDIYNVILGNKNFGGKDIMSTALGLMCSYIIDNYREIITVKVLKNNYNAIKWFKRNNFIECETKKDYIAMELDSIGFLHKEFKIKTF